VVDYYLKLVEAMGAADLRVEFALPERPEPTVAAHDLLVRHGAEPQRYAVLIPGSAQVRGPQTQKTAFGRPSKCWPAERFAALADRIASEHGLTVAATGGKPESGMIEQIRSLAQHPIANLAGQTSLPELTEVLRRAKLVVSNDTGPGHLAAALGRPLVMLFSWSNPLRVGPYGRPECVVARDAATRGLAIKSHDPRHAIEHISLEEVCLRVTEQLIGRRPEAGL
jgi:ADP-heptose:LPS heptosyltransferase